jgi:hypothetical protein
MKTDEMNGTNRTYRMKSSQRVVAVVLLLFGLLFTTGIWCAVLTGARDPKFLEIVFPLGFTLVSAVFTWRAFRNAVRFSDHAVELRSLSGMHVLPLDKIKGRRRYLSRGDENSPDVWHLVLEPNDDRYPKLDIEELYGFDKLFYTWFNALPDLDEIDKTRAKASIFGLV